MFYKKFKLRQSSDESIKAARYLKSAPVSPKEVKKERIDYQFLKEGDYFGGRALLTKEVESSKFTIISESKEVKVFIITSKNLIYLSEECMVTTK